MSVPTPLARVSSSPARNTSILRNLQSGDVRQICALHFKDGQTVIAQICARSRYDTCVVQYTGAVGRLPFAFETADSVLLRAYFQSFARELKAQFTEEQVGEWMSPGSQDQLEEAALEAR